MSRKAGLHAENYTVKENVERDTTDAETGLNDQQKTSDGLKIEGLALPFGKRSRNGVIYEKDSVKEAADSLVGCSLLFNHDEDNPIGHIENVEITDEGLKYHGDLNGELKEVESLERGDIPHVSIQAMIEETAGTEKNGEVAITEFLEMSAVTVPGFSQTDVETSDETVMIEKLVTEKEAKEKLQEEESTESEQVGEGFEFVPIPNLVLYDNEQDARERANDLGIEGIHAHEYDNQTFYMAGETHGEWRQLVGKQEEESTESFSDYPQEAVENARQALEAEENPDFNNDECGTQVGWERANQLDNGENLSEDTIQRMHSFFERHDGNQEVEEEPKEEDCGWLTWKAWGGRAAFDWATEKLEEIEDEEEEDVSKEPFAGYKDFDECVADNQDKADPEAYCAAIKRKAEITERILGENQDMTRQLSEQLEDVSSSEFYELVAAVHENLTEEDVESLFEEFSYEGNVMESLESIAEEEDDMDDDEEEEPEDEKKDGDDEEDDDETEESKESESSDLNEDSQDGNNDSDKTREELESRIEELEETIMELEDTEPSKQEGANTPDSEEGFSVRQDTKERLDR